MSYDVSIPDPILNRLSRLKDKVRAIGRGKELARVLSGLLDDLTHRPNGAGELMYTLRHIPMPARAIAKEYLGVVYFVHELEKLVIVTKLSMAEEHPFPPGLERIVNN